MLKISNLSVSSGETEILKNINLVVEKTQKILILGKNGSGKSTLINTISGNPNFQISSGSIVFLGKKLNTLSPEKRFKMGIFQTFQEPPAIPGLSTISILKESWKSRFGKYPDSKQFIHKIKDILNRLSLPDDFYKLEHNFNISGGQKKKLEFLQILILTPTLLLLDEIDSGLDRESQDLIAQILNKYIQETDSSAIIVSHNLKAKELFQPDKIFKMKNQTLEPDI